MVAIAHVRPVLRAVGRLLVRRIENVVFLGALAWFLAALYGALTCEGLGWTPADLRETARAAREHLASTRPKPFRITPYAQMARNMLQPVPVSPYAITAKLCPPLQRIRKRIVPAIFPIQELQAGAGRGRFAMASPTGPDIADVRQSRGQRWVVVTGVIEHRQQIEAYRTALRRASFTDPRRDWPNYVYFRVERAEVRSGHDQRALDWTGRPVRPMYYRQRFWAHPSQEIVDARYIPPPRSGISLVFPLGPRLDREWGSEVSHPRIVLQEERAQEEARQRLAVQQWRDALAQFTRSYGLLEPDSAMPGLTAQAFAPTDSHLVGPEYLLFRYFDYDVEPGKAYRYRAKLMLANPNYRLPPELVEQEKTAELPYLESQWSEPSPIVGVPRHTQVLVVDADPRTSEATLMMVYFSADTGEFVAETVEARRGQLLNFYDRPFPGKTDQAPSTPVSLFDPMKPTPRTMPLRKMDYVTDLILLDISGGDRLPAREQSTEPVRLLLMDKDGNLVVRDQLDDLREYRLRRPREKAPARDTLAVQSRTW